MSADTKQAKAPVKSVKPEWNDDLQFDAKTGKIHRMLSNAVLILTKHPEWLHVLGFDTFAQKEMICRRPPYKTTGQVPFAIDDGDLMAIREWVEECTGFDIGHQLTEHAVRAAARKHSYHPVKDYLQSLEWDGVERLDHWLADHLGVEDTALHRAYGSKWLLASVKRIFEPGCKFDAVIVLEGAPNIGKSEVLKILAGGDEWFQDRFSDIGNKDLLQEIQGIWIGEFAEFDKLGKAEANRAKAFITTRVDKYRASYGRMVEAHPRQIVFAVTINPGSEGYLVDETGNRRYWAVECGTTWDEDKRRVDFAALQGARDDLFAEAVFRYRMDEPIYLPDYLEDESKAAIEPRVQTDAWHDKIRDYLRNRDTVTSDEIFSECLHVEVKDRDQVKRRRAGRVLKMLGWSKFEAVHVPGDGTKSRSKAPADWLDLMTVEREQAAEERAEMAKQEGGNVVPMRPDMQKLLGVS